MADRRYERYSPRNRVIRQRNVALALVLAFFVALFFAITVVKMRHVRLPHRTPSSAATNEPSGSGIDGQ